jgi:hypothetical protein
MKQFSFVVFIFLTIQSFGQKIRFDRAILYSQDSSIIAIRELWRSYVLSFKDESDKTDLKYWNKLEIEQGHSDIVISITPFRSFQEADVQTFEIKKFNGQFYRIKNILTLGEANSPFFTIIYNVFARKDGSVYKFYNSLYLNKSKLQYLQTENIDLFYPNGYKFDKQKALELSNIYSGMIKTFGNPNKNRVTYLIGNNLDEAYKNIGVEYTPFSTSNLFAGQYIENQNVILTCREDHLHELVHTILKKYGGSVMFQEGIATFYGGRGGVNYSNLIYRLQKIITNKPGMDLSKFDDLDKSLNNGDFDNFYVVGAIFIDYAFKCGGLKKVLALFQYEDTGRSFDGAIKAISNELAIPSDQIDSFLKKYIKNYRKPD